MSYNLTHGLEALVTARIERKLRCFRLRVDDVTETEARSYELANRMWEMKVVHSIVILRKKNEDTVQGISTCTTMNNTVHLS